MIYRIVMYLIIGFTGLILYTSFSSEASVSIKDTGVHPGKAVYDEYCLTCHQADGRGVPGMNPPISKTDWVTGDKERLIQVLLKGLKTPLTINGEEYHNPMPAHAFLTNQQIADVLSYIRSNFSNKASAIKAEEVEQVRLRK